jgi:hypothetical protein
MLKEVVPTRQVKGEPRRVWYLDDDMDLIVWYAEQGAIIGFQLTTDKRAQEHALTWFERKGFSHHRVDDGEGRPGRPKMSPILVEDGALDAGLLLERFEERAQHLPAALRECVRGKLREYGGGRP